MHRSMLLLLTCSLTVWHAASSKGAEPSATSSDGLPLVFHEDFEHGAEHWEPTDKNAWKIVASRHGSAYSQHQASKYTPPVRSPFNFALRKDATVGDFVLEADCLSTKPDYNHRDLCLVFGYQDASHFYYVHLGKKTDDHANQIFIVNGTPRTKISTKTTPGTNWDDLWHHVKIVRRVSDGRIDIFFDDMQRPVMQAVDKTFAWGRVGVGSFDDIGDWDDVVLYGTKVDRPAATSTSAAPAGEPTNAQEAAAKKAAEDAAVTTKYEALVATFSPERQAWQRTLQANLGTFYLPIHKRSLLAGRSSCWDFVEDDPKLPRVLLIGDSISGGYTLPTRRALAGVANVHKAPENCGPTANGLKKLDVWLDGGHWDVVHFNFGIHDRRTPLDAYSERLELIVNRLEKTGAKLIWATTAPIPAGTKDGPTMPAAIVERNEVAAKLMASHGIAVDDLYATLLPHASRVMKIDDVHPNGEGYELLGQQVAASIRKELASSTKTP